MNQVQITFDMFSYKLRKSRERHDSLKECVGMLYKALAWFVKRPVKGPDQSASHKIT